jgi:hypothetical protein
MRFAHWFRSRGRLGDLVIPCSDDALQVSTWL